MATTNVDLFVYLEINAWEHGKDESTRVGVNQRFPGHAAVERGARNAWPKVTAKDGLADAIRTWRDARNAVEADANDLALQQALREALRALRPLRDAQKFANTVRTVNYLRAREADSDTTITALTPPAVPPEIVVAEAAFRDAQTALDAGQAGVGPVPDLADAGEVHAYVEAHRLVLGCQRTLSTTLADLIATRQLHNTEGSTGPEGALNDQLAASNTSITTLVADLTLPVALEAQQAGIDNNDGPDDPPTDQKWTLMEAFITRRVALHAAHRDFAISIDNYLAPDNETDVTTSAIASAYLSDLRHKSSAEETRLKESLESEEILSQAKVLARDLDATLKACPNPPEDANIDILKAFEQTVDQTVYALLAYRYRLGGALQMLKDDIELLQEDDGSAEERAALEQAHRDTENLIAGVIVSGNAALQRSVRSKIAELSRREFNRIQRGRLPGDWVSVDVTGQGGMGKVWTWVKQNKFGVIVDRVVIKDTITGFPGAFGWSGSGDSAEGIPLEVDMMERIRDQEQPGCENVVNIFNWRRDPQRTGFMKSQSDAGVDFDRDCYRIYIEWCGHGDLTDLLEKANDGPRIPEAFLWALFQALINACRAMEGHDFGIHGSLTSIVHSDMKLANVFLSENTSGTYVGWPLPKIGDFGLARLPAPDEEEDQAYKYRGLGSDDNMAPEQAAPSTSRAIDEYVASRVADVPSSKSNVWGVGNIIWSMMELKQGDPRLGNWYNTTKGAIVEIPDDEGLQPEFTEQSECYSRELHTLVSQCVKYQPSQRLSVQQIQAKMDTVLEKTGLDGGLKDASANDAKWANNMFRVLPDYVQKGLVLQDVRDRKGNAISGLKTAVASTTGPDDYGGKKGEDILRTAEELRKMAEEAEEENLAKEKKQAEEAAAQNRAAEVETAPVSVEGEAVAVTTVASGATISAGNADVGVAADDDDTSTRGSKRTRDLEGDELEHDPDVPLKKVRKVRK